MHVASARVSPAALLPGVVPALAAALLLLFARPADAVAAIAGGLFLLWLYRRPAGIDPGAGEKLLFFTAGFYILVWLIAAGAHWQLPTPVYAGYAALVLVYPAHRLCRTAALGETALWWCVGLAAAAAAIGAALWLALSGPMLALGPPWWSVVAFSLGAMALGGIDFGASGRWGTRPGLFLLLAGVVGVMAGLAAGSWGVWLALPAVFAVWFLSLPGHLSPRYRWSAVLALLVGVEILLLVDGTGVMVRFRRLILQTDVWWHSGGAAGLFGIVLRDWSGALGAFAAHPLIGTGAKHAGDLNQYVLTLHDSGLLGALALGLLIGVPGRAFARAARHSDPAVRRVGRAGLLLVIGYGVMALVEPVFSANRTLAFYALTTTALYAVARQLRVAAREAPVTRRQTLSVTVIAKNEADRIGRCLASVVGWADEIVVLDSGSDDDTVTIARQYTDRVEVTDWPGYGVQKQRALERARCQWVLSLDADEVVTPELRHDIDAALSEAPECVGYRLPWAVVAYGKRLDFGRHARAPLRLVQRDNARFTSDIVHEKIEPPAGVVGQLEGWLLHYTVRDYGHALGKAADYAWLGARLRHARGRHGGGLAIAALRCLWVFVHVYVLRFGFLDGGPGFLDAAINAQYAFNKYAGLWDLRRAAKTSDQRIR